ncbi:MAG: hypothetical protein ACFFAS_06450 [Promethearchaeota archaeon]
MKKKLILCENCGENIDNILYECLECHNTICNVCSITCRHCKEKFCESCYIEHKIICKTKKKRKK